MPDPSPDLLTSADRPARPTRARGVIDAATMSATGRPTKAKIKLTLIKPNGHRIDIATNRPPTAEMIADADALIEFLTTGVRRAAKDPTP